MSFGAGHIMDMINRMKQNRAQRPSNRSKFKENNREAIYSTEKEVERPIFKTIPEEELDKIKTKIRKQAKTERIKYRIINGAVVLFGLILFIGLLVWLKVK
ncbi:MAG: hypothetical protein ACK5NB_05270 [Flavobacteriaceae bacterium]